MAVLSGIRIVEIAGIGPGPFCGMLLADLGADVILVERPARAGDPLELGKHAIVHRGKRSIELDLKQPAAVEAVLRLIETSDALIEGMRPGVMERLGLGPDLCLARNPHLVYGRMTGWGQDGPLAQAAGHDLNYVALSGAAWYAGEPGSGPLPPPTLVGDLGGGALYLALGLLAGILHVKTGGMGQVVDAAVVDGSANLMNLLLSLHAAGMQPVERGLGLLDGPHWYGVYRCADGSHISIGALEPQFYAQLLQRLGVQDDPEFQAQYRAREWPRLRDRFATLFASQPRAYWLERLEGSDACFAPVLAPAEAMEHPHLATRGVYTMHDGVLQAAPAPRFSLTPAAGLASVPVRGAHGGEVLREQGFAEHEIEQLLGKHA